jgi:hypothetical protein
MTDTDRIVVTIALVIAFAAIAFALSVVLRRQQLRQNSMMPIGFVHF